MCCVVGSQPSTLYRHVEPVPSTWGHWWTGQNLESKEWPLGGSSAARVLEKVTPSLEERAPGRELPLRVGSAPACASEEVCSASQNASQTVPSVWDEEELGLRRPSTKSADSVKGVRVRVVRALVWVGSKCVRLSACTHLSVCLGVCVSGGGVCICTCVRVCVCMHVCRHPCVCLCVHLPECACECMLPCVSLCASA